MIRNFVTGIVVGGVVAGAGLGVISQLTPLPRLPVAAETGTNTATAPKPAVVVAAEPEVAKPADKPKAGAAEKAATAVDAPVAAAESAPVAEVPAKVATAEPAAMAEAPKAAVEKPQAPANPAETAPQPQTSAEPPKAPAATPEGTVPPEVATQVEASPAAVVPKTLPAASAADAAPAPTDLPPPAAEASEVLLNKVPETKNTTDPAMTALDPAPDAAVPVAPVKDLPKVLDTSKPEGLAPSAGLTKTVDGVTTGRLPSIGSEAKPEQPTETEAAAAAPEASVKDDRPVAKYAREFSNDDGKPLFAVLLLDKGGADEDRAKLAALPFAVTFVIDPLDPGAAAAEAIYRAAGQEVVMLASGIPAGATAGDLEQTFQANAAVLQQAVAVMDIGAAGFQDNRPLATQVVPVIAAQGRGVVTFDKGLNAADQVARREGVPAAVIFRELDAAGEDTPLIRRYLDRAAFKAAQEGRVVVLGSTRPETVAALMEWTLEGRASSVALAPLTAVMVVK